MIMMQTDDIKDKGLPFERWRRTGMGYEYNDYICPKCKRLVAYEPSIMDHTDELYCKRCGQKFDWTEVLKENKK